MAITEILNEPDLTRLDKYKLSELVPQLKSIYLAWSFLRNAPHYIRNHLDKILFECYRFDFGNFAPHQLSMHHLRLIESSYTQVKHPLHQLEELVRWIQDPRQSTLRSLYLDPALHPTTKASLELMEAMGRVREACEAKRIEVIYEVQPSEMGFGAVLSEEFCRRQRESRRLEADQTASGAQETSY